MTRLVTLLAALCLTGCPKKSPPPEPGGNHEFDERQACAVDDDCAVVEIGCCDHCNDGAIVGIHKDYAAEVHRSYTAECGEVSCTERGCVDEPVPRCLQGICGFSIGRQQSTPALPPP